MTEKKDKKAFEALLSKIEYDADSSSVINTVTAVLTILAVVEIVSGIFMNGYSFIADGLHNIVSAILCVKLGKNIKKVFAAAVIPFSVFGAYLCLKQISMSVSYLDSAPQIWLFMVMTPVLLVKIGLAIVTADKIKLNKVKYLNHVSTQMNICVLSAVATAAGLFASFFVEYFIEPTIALAIFMLTVLESVRVFGQFRAEYIEKIIADNTPADLSENEPDEFAPISVGEIHRLSKAMGDDDEVEEKEEEKEDTEVNTETKTENKEEVRREEKCSDIVEEPKQKQAKKKTERIFVGEERDEEDDW